MSTSTGQTGRDEQQPGGDPVDEQQQQPGQVPPADPDVDRHERDDEQQPPPRNREARYRTERNEARAQVEQLQARVDALLTREVERLAGARLAQGADLLTVGGVKLADVVDDNGDPDPGKVDAAVAALLRQRPRLARLDWPKDIAQGRVGKGAPTTASWSDVIRGR